MNYKIQNEHSYLASNIYYHYKIYITDINDLEYCVWAFQNGKKFKT